jgi:hypothetical protein
MDFMSLLDRDLPSEKGGQSRHFNRSMLSAFRERSAKTNLAQSPKPPAEFSDNPLKRQDSWTKSDLDFLPPGLDFLPTGLDFLPAGLDFLPPSLEFLPSGLETVLCGIAGRKSPSDRLWSRQEEAGL